MVKVCLVAVAIGQRYLEEYTRLFMPSHTNYAKKHGYDFRVIDDFLDKKHTGYKTISLNKILVCSQPWSEQYDFVVFVDADVLINIRAPPIHACTDFGDKIGIADEYGQTDKDTLQDVQYKLNWGNGASDYYAKSDFNIQTDKMLNTGVLVFQPRKHRSFLDSIYEKYIDIAVDHSLGFHFEQAMIGYELQTQNKFVLLPKQFNSIWVVQKSINTFKVRKAPFFNGRFILSKVIDIHEYFRNSYFMHLAAHQDFHKVPELQKNNVL
jgi:hypothetical protein